jgi:hypothetical protein
MDFVKEIIKCLLENEFLLFFEMIFVPLLARHALKVKVIAAHRARLVSFVVPSLDASGAKGVTTHEVAIGIGRVAD